MAVQVRVPFSSAIKISSLLIVIAGTGKSERKKIQEGVGGGREEWERGEGREERVRGRGGIGGGRVRRRRGGGEKGGGEGERKEERGRERSGRGVRGMGGALTIAEGMICMLSSLLIQSTYLQSSQISDRMNRNKEHSHLM